MRDQDRRFTEAAWMLAKGLRFILDATRCDDPGASYAALAEADTDARLLRAMSAACAPPRRSRTSWPPSARPRSAE